VTVTDNTELIQALNNMLSAGVYACAVVDQEMGLLISTLSMSDLRGAFRVVCL